MDFMSDLACLWAAVSAPSMWLMTLTANLAIEIDLEPACTENHPRWERIIAWRGYPQQIQADNGPEFISTALADWAETHGIHLNLFNPESPAVVC